MCRLTARNDCEETLVLKQSIYVFCHKMTIKIPWFIVGATVESRKMDTCLFMLSLSIRSPLTCFNLSIRQTSSKVKFAHVVIFSTYVSIIFPGLFESKVNYNYYINFIENFCVPNWEYKVDNHYLGETNIYWKTNTEINDASEYVIQ